MGQRTQMLVQVIDKNGVEKNSMYHIQWGQGRIMFVQLMDLAITDFLRPLYEKRITETIFLKECVLDITDTFTTKEMCHINIENMHSIKSRIGKCENNDGAMIIQIKEDEYSNTKVKFGFLLGKEIYGVKMFTKYVSIEEYIKHHGYNYVDDDFLIMFKLFLKTFDIDVMIS